MQLTNWRTSFSYIPNLIVPHALMRMAERGSKSKNVPCYSLVRSFIFSRINILDIFMSRVTLNYSRHFSFYACFLYPSWTLHQFESFNHIVDTNAFYKYVFLAFFFESSYIRNNIPKWISTFNWFWSCVSFLRPTRWHVKLFWTFRYFRLKVFILISLFVKSLVCRNLTRVSHRISLKVEAWYMYL